MFRDFKELLSVLNAHRVKYLVVGAYAVSLHAEPRATKDLDVLIGSSAENGKAAFAALAEFGAPLDGQKAAKRTLQRIPTSDELMRCGGRLTSLKRMRKRRGVGHTRIERSPQTAIGHRSTALRSLQPK